MTIFLGFTTGLFLGTSVLLVLAGLAVYTVQQEMLTIYQTQLDENEDLITRMDNRYFMKELNLEETEAE